MIHPRSHYEHLKYLGRILALSASFPVFTRDKYCSDCAVEFVIINYRLKFHPIPILTLTSISNLTQSLSPSQSLTITLTFTLSPLIPTPYPIPNPTPNPNWANP